MAKIERPSTTFGGADDCLPTTAPPEQQQYRQGVRGGGVDSGKDASRNRDQYTGSKTMSKFY